MTPIHTDPALSDYPARIAAANAQLYREHTDFETARQDVADLEMQYREQAAYNADLTNDAKRKAYVEEQKQSDGLYGDALARMADAEHRVRVCERDERRLRDEFAVAKLGYERGTALVAAGLPGLVYDLDAVQR